MKRVTRTEDARARRHRVRARQHHCRPHQARQRIVFTEENDQRHQFTWRTIQTWYSRYQKDGITSMHPGAAPTRA